MGEGGRGGVGRLHGTMRRRLVRMGRGVRMGGVRMGGVRR